MMPISAKDGLPELPKNHIDFCRVVARLARKHRVHDFHLKLRPGYKDDWRHHIECFFEQGRHGDANRKIRIVSTIDEIISTEVVP